MRVKFKGVVILRAGNYHRNTYIILFEFLKKKKLKHKSKKSWNQNLFYTEPHQCTIAGFHKNLKIMNLEHIGYILLVVFLMSFSTLLTYLAVSYNMDNNFKILLLVFIWSSFGSLSICLIIKMWLIMTAMAVVHNANAIYWTRTFCRFICVNIYM